MNVLVLNPGSSSIKVSLFALRHADGTPQSLLDGEIGGIGSSHATLHIKQGSGCGTQTPVTAQSIPDALKLLFTRLGELSLPLPDAIGYRVVHPGPHVRAHQPVTPELLQQLKASSAFAPLHDPVTLDAIHAGMDHYPNTPHFACFDTVFHQTMPVEASIYPVPVVYRDQGVHRYGFHGLSCESVVRQLTLTGKPVPKRMIIAHLGSGCSVTALLDGRSVDNTMGLTPTGGVVMGTRPGDLDPGLLLYLLRRQQGTVEQAASSLESLLNRESGMVALSGLPNNVKDLRSAAAHGNRQAVLALTVFTRSITRAIGGFCWLLKGLDAIVFTGGIGEHDPLTRAEVLSHLEPLGVILDLTRNDTARNAAPGESVAEISVPTSPTSVLVVPAQEDLMIALHIQQMMQPNTGQA
jgi:acetate kinase